MKEKAIKSIKLKLITNYKKELNKHKNEEIRNSLFLTLTLFNDKVREIQEFFFLCKQETYKINTNKVEELFKKEDIQNKLIEKVKQINIRNNSNFSYMYYLVNRELILNTCRKFYNTLFHDKVKVNEHGGWSSFLFGTPRELDIFKKDIEKKTLSEDLIKLGLYPVFSSYRHILKNSKQQLKGGNIRFETDCLNSAVRSIKSWRTGEQKFNIDLEDKKSTAKTEEDLIEFNNLNNLDNYMKFTYAHHLYSPRYPNFEYSGVNRNILNYYLEQDDDNIYLNLPLFIKNDKGLELKDFKIKLAPSNQLEKLQVDNSSNIICYKDKNNFISVSLGESKLLFDKNFLNFSSTNKNYPGPIFISLTQSMDITPDLNNDYIMSVDLGIRNYASYSIVKKLSDETIEVIKSGFINLQGDKVTDTVRDNRNNIYNKLKSINFKLTQLKEYKLTDKLFFTNELKILKKEFQLILKEVECNKNKNLNLGVSLWSIDYMIFIRKLKIKFRTINNKSNKVANKKNWGIDDKSILDHINNKKSNRLKEGVSAIINIALAYKCKTLIFEDLSQFKVNSFRNKHQNKLLASWAKGKTTELIEQKCNYYKIDFIKANAAYTSQIDNVTHTFGLRFDKEENKYKRTDCGTYFISLKCNGELYIQDADINASLNIVKFYLFNSDKKNKKKNFISNFYKKEENKTFLKDLSRLYFDSDEWVERTKFYDKIQSKLLEKLSIHS